MPDIEFLDPSVYLFLTFLFRLSLLKLFTSLLLLELSLSMFMDFSGEPIVTRYVSCKSYVACFCTTPLPVATLDMFSIRFPGFGCFAFWEMMLCWPGIIFFWISFWRFLAD